MLIDINSLKQRQDEIEKRKKNLLENFFPFRESFINYLENFIAEAMKSGIKDIEPFDKSKSSSEITRISATINTMPFVILSTDETYFNDSEDEEYASKIFIYGDGNQNPSIIITFQESKENKNIYFAKWNTTEGLKWLMGNSVVVNPRISGEEAGNKLVNHLYSFTFFWNDTPMFDRFSNERYSKKSFGFVK
jgi:hypothetical protein